MPDTFAQQSQQLNIYLKPAKSDHHMEDRIRSINKALSDRAIISKYRLQPFIENHPLHITLYLSHYPLSAIEDIKQKVSALASQTAPITVSSDKLWLSPGLYLMLDIDKKAEDFEALQHLSDETTTLLSPLHDTKAPPPRWIKSLAIKEQFFLRYGSPNVFGEFNPHFTLLATRIDDKHQAKRLMIAIQSVIEKYNHQHLQAISQSMDSIGIGLVSQYGQVAEELASYPLTGRHPNE